MPRIFAYTRVSTINQETENQIKEIESAGFAIEKHRVIVSACNHKYKFQQSRIDSG